MLTTWFAGMVQRQCEWHRQNIYCYRTSTWRCILQSSFASIFIRFFAEQIFQPKVFALKFPNNNCSDPKYPLTNKKDIFVFWLIIQSARAANIPEYNTIQNCKAPSVMRFLNEVRRPRSQSKMPVNTWPDHKTFMLISEMKRSSKLRRSFNKYNPIMTPSKRRLEQMLDRPIKEITRKWKTLRAYYNKLKARNESKQNRWRFFKEMSSIYMEMTADDFASSHAVQSSLVRSYDFISS